MSDTASKCDEDVDTDDGTSDTSSDDELGEGSRILRGLYNLVLES
jgi:hypothetical protein